MIHRYRRIRLIAFIVKRKLAECSHPELEFVEGAPEGPTDLTPMKAAVSADYETNLWKFF